MDKGQRKNCKSRDDWMDFAEVNIKEREREREARKGIGKKSGQKL